MDSMNTFLTEWVFVLIMGMSNKISTKQEVFVKKVVIQIKSSYKIDVNDAHTYLS